MKFSFFSDYWGGNRGSKDRLEMISITLVVDLKIFVELIRGVWIRKERAPEL